MNKILKDYFSDLANKNAKRALDYFIMGKVYPYEIQYANEKTYRWIVKYCYEVCKTISEENSDKLFLDFGCGIGAIEYFNDLFFDCNIDSCDWKERDQIYEIMSLKNPKYYCSDWLSENFEIYDCKIKYDVIIIMRSILLHKHPDNNDEPNTLPNFINQLKKLVPYVKPSGSILLLQPSGNFLGDIKNFLNKNNKKFFKTNPAGIGEIYNLEPSTIETFVF